MTAAVQVMPLTGTTHDLSGYQGGQEAMKAAFLVHFLDGTQPFVRAFEALCEGESALDLPDGFLVERRWRVPGQTWILARSECATLLATFGGSRAVKIRVSASSQELADVICESLIGQSGLPTHDDTVPLKVIASNGNMRTVQRNDIEAPFWDDIMRNYPPAVRSHLSTLMEMSGPGDGGRLVLWHGPPGTGKSTALRALARSWRDWCDAVYVVDPEAMFRNPAYLLDVMSAESPRTGQPPRWQLVIAEDTDEYLRVTARRDEGAALGRLLNVTDGILGQGMRTIVVLTTNEDISTLHPALTRPGRCLAEIGFALFTPEEARAWLPGDEGSSVVSDLSLAELYTRAGGTMPVSVQRAEPAHEGMYL